jgi:hypothetical protein
MPKPKPRCTTRPYAGVPFRRRAGIPSFSGRRGRTGTAPHSRLPFLHRSRRFPLLCRQTVGRVILRLIYFFGGIYIFLTFLPTCGPTVHIGRRSAETRSSGSSSCPVPALLGIYFSQCLLRSDTFERVRMRFLFFVQSLLWTMSALQEDIRRALQCAVATIDDDDDIEIFLKGIPGTSQKEETHFQL